MNTGKIIPQNREMDMSTFDRTRDIKTPSLSNFSTPAQNKIAKVPTLWDQVRK